MKSIELENIIHDCINGNFALAIEAISKGCKSKPAKYAARTLYVYRELIGMGRDGVAGRLHVRIEAEGEKL